MSSAVHKICDILVSNVHVALSILLHALVGVVLVVQVRPVGHAQLQYKHWNVHTIPGDRYTSMAVVAENSSPEARNSVARSRRIIRPPHSIRHAVDMSRQSTTTKPSVGNERIGALLPKFSAHSVDPRSKKLAATKIVHSSSLTRKDIHLLSSRLSSCWSILSDVAYSSKAVKVNLALDMHGRVLDITIPDMHIYNSDPVFRAVADSALRAVRKCSPFKELQNVDYETWKEIELTFDPTPS